MLHIIEKDRYRVVARQHEIDVLVAAIAFAALWPLLQDQVFNVMLVCQLVEADVSAGVVVEDEAAAAVGRAGGQKAIFIVALGRVDSVSVGFFILCGGVEVKLDAGEEGAVLIDLDAVGLGDVGQVEFHCEVRIRAAALEIEELQRVIGVVGEGLAAPGFGVGAVAIDRVFQVSSKDIVDVDICLLYTSDPAISPQQNAAKYYKNYQKAKTAEKVLTEQIAKGETELSYLESVLGELARAESERDIAEIRQELAEGGYIRDTQGKKRMKLPASRPMRFRSTEGFVIWVGRNNRQNDQLTLKQAAKGDLWLHTQKIHCLLYTSRCV